jgi:hypothetical protein
VTPTDLGLPADAQVLGRDFPWTAITPGPIHDIYECKFPEEGPPRWERHDGWAQPPDKYLPRHQQNPFLRRYQLFDRNGKKWGKGLWWIREYAWGTFNSPTDGNFQHRLYVPPLDPPFRVRPALLPFADRDDPEPESTPEPPPTPPEAAIMTAPAPTADRFWVAVEHENPNTPPEIRSGPYATLDEARSKAETRVGLHTDQVAVVLGQMGRLAIEVRTVRTLRWDDAGPAPRPAPGATTESVVAPPAPEPAPPPAYSEVPLRIVPIPDKLAPVYPPIRDHLGARR